MKKCISCAKDIPDTAFHCVFCGSKQGQPQAAGPAQKTIMGYSAADLQKLLPNQQGGGGPPQQGGYVPAGGADQRTMMVGASPMAPQDQRTMMAGAGGAPLPNQGGADQRTMMAGVGGAPMGGMGGMGGQDQRTMMAGGMGPGPGMGMQQPMGQPMMQQPMGQPMMQQPMGQPMMQQPMGQPYQQQQPMGQPYQQQQPMGQPYQQQQPMGQRPQYLASQSAARDLSPSEPWAGTLRGLLIFFGIALIATFVVPASFSPMTFGFQILTSAAPFKAKLLPLVLAAGGVLSLLFGLLPVPSTARGIVAAIVGLAPIALTLALAGMEKMAGNMFGGWQAYALLVGMVVAPMGLLIRSAYRSAILGRLLATVGCAALLVPFLVPSGGNIPIVGMFQHIFRGGGGLGLMQIWMAVLPVIAVLGLIMAWMPSGTSAGTGFFAWLLILWPAILVLSGVITAVINGAPIGDLLKQPGGWLFPTLQVLSISSLTAYGLATIFGKSLEA